MASVSPSSTNPRIPRLSDCPHAVVHSLWVAESTMRNAVLEPPFAHTVENLLLGLWKNGMVALYCGNGEGFLHDDPRRAALGDHSR